MGEITLQGGPPYELPVLQNATARAEGEVVQMTVYVLTDGKELVPFEMRMTARTAQTLSGLLASSAITVELEQVRKK